MNETTDFSKHGLAYQHGYLCIVEPIGDVAKRDNRWIGELQLRHNPNKSMLTFCDKRLVGMSDEELADSYWSGAASNDPNWEITARSAKITKVMSTDPIEVRPPKFKLPL